MAIADNFKAAGSEIVNWAGNFINQLKQSSKGQPQKLNSQSVSNDVTNSPRIGHALKPDSHHAFPDVVDNYVGQATKFSLQNGSNLYQLSGSINGVDGRFEWIITNGQVVHRFFVMGGGINGIPIR